MVLLATLVLCASPLEASAASLTPHLEGALLDETRSESGLLADQPGVRARPAVMFSVGVTNRSGLSAPSIQSITEMNKASATPANPTASASDSMRADTVADVRRGACSRLSAASAPSTGRMRHSNGRNARASQPASAGDSSSTAKMISANPA